MGHRLSAIGCLVLGFVQISPSPAQEKNGRAYSLSLQSLQGKSGTEVILTVDAAVAKKVAIEARDPADGGILWREKLFDVRLEDGAATIPHPGLPRFAPVRAVVHVHDGREEILKAATVTLLRPDLAIAEIQAPSRVRAADPAPVEVVVRELNGDLGASFDVVLLEGDAAVDEALGVEVAPGGAVSVAFALSLSGAGRHEITAAIRNVSPGDYDASNHAATFAIEVESVESAAYELAYLNYQWKNSYAYWSSVETGSARSEGEIERITYRSTFGGALRWPVEQVSVRLFADGAPVTAAAVTNLQPARVWSWGGRSTSFTSVFLPEENLQLYLSSTAESSELSLWRFATANVYYSVRHNLVWGTTWSYSFQFRQGSIARARGQVHSHVVLTDDGRAVGGWGNTAAIRATETMSGFQFGDARQGGSGSSSARTWTGSGAGSTSP